MILDLNSETQSVCFEHHKLVGTLNANTVRALGISSGIRDPFIEDRTPRTPQQQQPTTKLMRTTTTTMKMMMLPSARLFSRTTAALFSRSFASVGDPLPSVDLHLGFPPQKHNLADLARDKSIVLLGLPGAFTPT